MWGNSVCGAMLPPLGFQASRTAGRREDFQRGSQQMFLKKTCGSLSVKCPGRQDGRAPKGFPKGLAAKVLQKKIAEEIPAHPLRQRQKICHRARRKGASNFFSLFSFFPLAFPGAPALEPFGEGPRPAGWPGAEKASRAGFRTQSIRRCWNGQRAGSFGI